MHHKWHGRRMCGVVSNSPPRRPVSLHIGHQIQILPTPSQHSAHALLTPSPHPPAHRRPPPPQHRTPQGAQLGTPSWTWRNACRPPKGRVFQQIAARQAPDGAQGRSHARRRCTPRTVAHDRGHPPPPIPDELRSGLACASITCDSLHNHMLHRRVTVLHARP